jgi:hypothetical protein
MNIINTIDKTEIAIRDDSSIPEGWTSIPFPTDPRFCIWSGNNWDINLTIQLTWAKQNKLNKIKQKASNIIISIYPEWKQINLDADREYALGYVAKFKNKSNDTINNELVDKLMGLSIVELKSIRDNFSNLNIDDLIVDIPNDYIEQVRLQYQNIATSYIAYVLIKEIRKWSNDKEIILNTLNTIEEINNLNIEDYTTL